MRRPHQPAISAHCCAAPATSPVCPPICREANAVIAAATLTSTGFPDGRDETVEPLIQRVGAYCPASGSAFDCGLDFDDGGRREEKRVLNGSRPSAENCPFAVGPGPGFGRPARVRPYTGRAMCDHILPSAAAPAEPCDHISPERRYERR